MRTLPASFRAYEWAPSTEELALRVGLDPVELVRFDGNVPPLPLPSSRPGAIAGALADVNTYPHGGYPYIHEAIAVYAGVEPENVVLGAGGDDLIMLCRARVRRAGRRRCRAARADVSPVSRCGRARRSHSRRRIARIDVLLPSRQPARRPAAAARCPPTRRRRGVLRVRGRDRGSVPRRGRHRHPHVLEGLRPRGSASRLPAGRPRHRRRVAHAAVARPRLDALGGTRPRSLAHAARRHAGARGARASRRRAARTRARAPALARELPLCPHRRPR